MVEVFKTNVMDTSGAEKLITLIQRLLPCCKISFDLADCDKILRVEDCCQANALKVITLVEENGYQCQVLE